MAAGAVFDCANVPFNLWDMFILGTEIKADVAKDGLKQLKFQICKGHGNMKNHVGNRSGPPV